MKKTLLLLSLVFIISCADDKQTTNTKTDETLLENPSFMMNEDVVVFHRHYQLAYLEQYEQAQWVAYELLESELVKNYERTDNFNTDMMVLTGTADDDDYKGSGYDRGHLMPAAVCTWDSIAMYESFYYSNISPQNASFNRGVWGRLEDIERDLAVKYGKVWVVITPLFDNIIEYIGANQVAVPGGFGRAFLVREGETYKGVAFILNNEKYESDFDIINNASLTIDSLEAVTGLDLFFNLNDAVEPDVEKVKSLEIFK